jgi:hypothetical protein
MIPSTAPVVQPLPPSVPSGPAPSGGYSTRGTNKSLCMNNCRHHVRHLFLNTTACFFGANCAKTHQDNLKSFSKNEMCNWVDATCKAESDYVALRAAIVSKA